MAAADFLQPSVLGAPTQGAVMRDANGISGFSASNWGTHQVDVPFVHYRQTMCVKEVKVPVEVTKVAVKKVEVAGIHEIPIIKPREVYVHQTVRRNVPDPVDVYTVQTYNLPRIQPKYYDVEVPIYVPRYIEVPVPSHFVTLQKEEIPDIVPVDMPLQGLTSAPVLKGDQTYSLASAGTNEAGTAPIASDIMEASIPLERKGSACSVLVDSQMNEALKAEVTITGSSYQDEASVCEEETPNLDNEAMQDEVIQSSFLCTPCTVTREEAPAPESPEEEELPNEAEEDDTASDHASQVA